MLNHDARYAADDAAADLDVACPGAVTYGICPECHASDFLVEVDGERYCASKCAAALVRFCLRCLDNGIETPATDGDYCSPCHDFLGERQDERASR